MIGFGHIELELEPYPVMGAEGDTVEGEPDQTLAEMSSVVSECIDSGDRLCVPSDAESTSRGGSYLQVAEMRELYARGDVEGALRIASGIVISTKPLSIPPPAVRGAKLPVAVNRAMPIAVSLPLDLKRPSAAVLDTGRRIVPRLLFPPTAIIGLPIDHRAGFLLALIDGVQTLDEILDVCPMTVTEALAVLTTLESFGLVAVV
jgi:hypothetical protein